MANKNISRADRVGDKIHREVAGVLREDFNNPTLGFITVVDVTMSSDLRYAKIYITVLEPEKVDSTVEYLNKNSGYFRQYLAKKLELRKVPEINFDFDASIQNGSKISQLLSEL